MVSFEGIPCEIRMFRGFENTNTNYLKRLDELTYVFDLLNPRKTI